MARRHHHRKAHRPPEPLPDDEDSLFPDFSDADWADHGMFVMGFTPDGAEFDVDENDGDLGADHRAQAPADQAAEASADRRPAE